MAPPSRSERATVLASSVQRSKSAPYPSKARSALTRRAVLAVLVLGALTLLTISFRSPTAGALHDLQSGGATVLRPFQVAATRVATPFRDGYDYVTSLSSAKSQLARVKRQREVYLAAYLKERAAAAKLQPLEKLLHFEREPSFPNDYRAVNAEVISFPSGPFAHDLTIAAGTSSGVEVNSPVVSGEGLVGLVTNASSDTATVRLLSDSASYVTARDLNTSVRGVVHPGTGGTLILDYVAKALKVHQGDELVTDGTRDARYPDLYPYGIPIGRVLNVEPLDTASFLQIQVQPFANLSSLDAVAVLVTTKHQR